MKDLKARLEELSAVFTAVEVKKIELLNPRLENYTHFRDLYIDEKFVKSGEFLELFHEIIQNENYLDSDEYLEAGETGYDFVGTVGNIRESEQRIKETLSL